MPFGKHSGQTLGQVLEQDAGYLDWLIGVDLTGWPMLELATRILVDRNADKIQKALERRAFRRGEK